jgi:hypothetical protein
VTQVGYRASPGYADVFQEDPRVLKVKLGGNFPMAHRRFAQYFQEILSKMLGQQGGN